ncbi:DUF6192 family protein [Streptomyces violascens]|uniref:DUF6192 family protein n=1 Tax=Streptomyces violascens TaxID=67381 RepID=UPI003647D269
MRAIEQNLEFLDLVGACHTFVASTNRLVPLFHRRTLPQDAQAVINSNLTRVRAACDWVAHADSTGETDMDAKPARLLRGVTGRCEGSGGNGCRAGQPGGDGRRPSPGS